MVVGSLAQVFQNPTKLCRLGVKGYAQTRFSTEHKSFQAYAVNLYQVPVFGTKLQNASHAVFVKQTSNYRTRVLCALREKPSDGGFYFCFRFREKCCVS